MKSGKKKHEIKLTDEQLEELSHAELLLLAQESITLAALSSRLTRGWSRRRAACEPASNRRSPAKDHPFKKFSGRFYSNKNRSVADERQKTWES
jgi:hypothetical protein